MSDETSNARRILVVEDDPDTRESLVGLLREEGYEVTEAHDGASALRALETGPRPHVIVLDLMMPGMDGWQFRTEQRRSPRLSEIPVVALSGDSSSKAKAVGSDVFISKPFKFDTLLDALRAVMNAAKKREQLAAELRADRIAAIGTLAARLAQAIADPLTLLVANLRLLREHASALVPTSHEGRYAQAMLAESLEAAERMRRLVVDVKAFASVEPEPRHRLDVRTVLESAANVYVQGTAHGHEVRFELGAVPEVEAVEAELAQVFFHLVANAAEASDPAKPITLRTRTGDDGFVVVEVRDEGSGIDPALAGKLFDPWFSTKSVGRGLGLTLCNAIVQAYGGRIEIDSAPGRGTIARVHLPPAA